MKQTSVLFIIPYPLDKAPSQRFRVEAFLPGLQAAGINCTLRPFITLATWQILYKSGSALKKTFGIFSGYFKRLKTILFEAAQYDFIFIHREAAPLGPPVFEWYLAKVLKKKIIYDFDDAIWTSPVKEPLLKRSLSFRKKVGMICSWSYHNMAGNRFLADYASQFSKQVSVIPTVVDTCNRYHNTKVHQSGPVVLGWTGSNSTNPYLEAMCSPLQKLQEQGIQFLFISSEPPKLDLPQSRFVKWVEETEIKDLMEMDLGWMPLPDNEWTKGKCGFKAIQYMALGIPALVSGVGVNTEIVDDGVNGYICNTDEDWVEKSALLANDSELRAAMGKAAKQKIQDQYSVKAVLPKILALFR